MTLGELIAALRAEPNKSRFVSHGFRTAHSYRGYYDQLAFVPDGNVTVASMLAHAETAVNAIFTGWKGGDYRMNEFTECWLAEQGDCGEPLTKASLALMLHGDDNKAEIDRLRALLKEAGESLREEISYCRRLNDPSAHRIADHLYATLEKIAKEGL